MELREVLIELDPTNDEHWTQDGQARTDVVTGLFGEKVTRDMIKSIAPKFCRVNTSLEEIAPVEQGGNPWDVDQGNNDEQLIEGDKSSQEQSGDLPNFAEQEEKFVPVNVDELNEEILELELELAKIDQARDALNIEYLDKQAEIDVLITKRDTIPLKQKRQTQAEMIRAYINSSSENQ